MVGLLRSRRFSLFLITLVALLALVALGVESEVTGPLAIGLGGALAVLLGGESLADRERAKHAPKLEEAKAEDEKPSPLDAILARAIDALMPALIGSMTRAATEPASDPCAGPLAPPLLGRTLRVAVAGQPYYAPLLDLGGHHLARHGREVKGSQWSIIGDVPLGLTADVAPDSYWLGLEGTPTEPGRYMFSVMRNSDGHRANFTIAVMPDLAAYAASEGLDPVADPAAALGLS